MQRVSILAPVNLLPSAGGIFPREIGAAAVFGAKFNLSLDCRQLYSLLVVALLSCSPLEVERS